MSWDGENNNTLGSSVAQVSIATMVQYALFVRQPWCDKIFDQEKSWELRSFPLPLSKRGQVVAIACSKMNVLLGEVRLKGCLKVGVKRDSLWVPASSMEKHKKNFFLAPRNATKIGFSKDNVPKVVDNYSRIFAWMIRDAKRYDKPKPWRPTRGAVTFCRINPEP